jgi:lipid A disaccharide synthetase
MCASDIGLVYDGQMASSAVACHLPAVNLIKMRMHHQWFHDLFNRWQSDMNIIANNNVSKELIGGEAWFGKIADTLGEWYVKPDTRYNMIRQWGNTIPESLSYKPIDRSVVRTRDIILADGNAYSEY